MEVAVTVIQSAGIHAVLARSFARSFYRNAMNNGLVAVECETAAIIERDRVSIALGDVSVSVQVPDRGIVLQGTPIPALMRRILESGGLVAFLREGGVLRP
jgi:3-isopropylmalate/(R)-2-methylmalate dehydratase small subunit